MELTIPPPHALLYVAIALLGVVIFSAVRRRGTPTSRVVRVAIGVFVIVGLLVFVYRPSHIKVDDQGISSDGGGTINIPWSQVSSSLYIANLPASNYRVTSKIGGIALGGYRIGTFRTAGGHPARLVAQQGNSALIVNASGRLYEFSPNEMKRMVTAVAEHVPVSGWPPG